MRFYFIIVLLVAGLKAAGQTQIKILSYNIYHGESAYYPGKPSLDSIAQLITEIAPDFVAVQEVDSATNRSALYYEQRTDLVKELAEKTGMNGYFGKAMDYDSGGYGIGLLSRFPMNVKVIALPNPASGEPRSLIYGEASYKRGKKIIFGSTHLCHKFNENKVAQVETINGLFNNPALPVVICGDFNFKSSEQPYQVMTKQWSDAAQLKGNPQNTFSFKNPDRRIDYAFISKNVAWKVVDVKVFPIGYSDHMPVLFTLELNQ